GPRDAELVVTAFAEAGHLPAAHAGHAGQVRVAVGGTDADELTMLIDGWELPQGHAFAQARGHEAATGQVRLLQRPVVEAEHLGGVVGPAFGVATSAVVSAGTSGVVEDETPVDARELGRVG